MHVVFCVGSWYSQKFDDDSVVELFEFDDCDDDVDDGVDDEFGDVSSFDDDDDLGDDVWDTDDVELSTQSCHILSGKIVAGVCLTCILIGFSKSLPSGKFVPSNENDISVNFSIENSGSSISVIKTYFDGYLIFIPPKKLL